MAIDLWLEAKEVPDAFQSFRVQGLGSGLRAYSLQGVGKKVAPFLGFSGRPVCP